MGYFVEFRNFEEEVYGSGFYLWVSGFRDVFVGSGFFRLGGR